MLYTLDAIPDEHPEHLIIHLIQNADMTQPEKVAFSKEIVNSCCESPMHAISPSFWEGVAERLLEKRETDNRWVFKVLSSLKLAMRIYQNHFNTFDARKYSRLYHEGPKLSLFAAYTRAKGSEVILLDKDNLFYEALFHIQDSPSFFGERGRRFQKKREGIWLSKIEPSPEINDSLLTCGGGHLQNEFGLVGGLSYQGIEIAPVAFDYDSLESKVFLEVLEKMELRK